MAKGQKSSASSGTRKKHARKAGGEQALPLPKEKKPKDKEKGKNKNKEPRKKVYIPPTKPAPVQLDPLDSLGLAKQLPADFVVVLRRLGKKDAVTKKKGIEELKNGWVDRVSKGADDEESSILLSSLLLALPVWTFQLASLLVHPSRLIRYLAAQLHLSILQVPSLRDEVVNYLRHSGDSTQVSLLLGALCLSAHDVDRPVSSQATRSWDLYMKTLSTSTPTTDNTDEPSTQPQLKLDGATSESLVPFIVRAIHEPLRLYADINPTPPPSIPSLHKPGARGGTPQPFTYDDQESTRKPDEEEESEEDRIGRLRTSAFGALKWLIEYNDTLNLPDSILALIADPFTWSALYHGDGPPFCELPDAVSRGMGLKQPILRVYAWNLLASMVQIAKTESESHLPTAVLSHAILRSCWVEPESTVRQAMWQPLMTFLRYCSPAWELAAAPLLPTHEQERNDEDDESDSDEDEGDDTHHHVNARRAPVLQDNSGSNSIDLLDSSAYKEFLTFLATGCRGSPLQGYPTIVIILLTLCPRVVTSSPSSWSSFFDALWTPCRENVFSSSLERERPGIYKSLFSAFQECMIFLVKRGSAVDQAQEQAQGEAPQDASASPREGICGALRSQFANVWTYLPQVKAYADATEAGKLLGRAFQSLDSIHQDFVLAAWTPLKNGIQNACVVGDTGNAADTAVAKYSMDLLLSIKVQASETAIPRHIDDLVSETGKTLIERFGEFLTSKSATETPTETANDATSAAQCLTVVIECFGETLVKDGTTNHLDNIVSNNLPSLLRDHHDLLISYLQARKDNSQLCSSWWKDALAHIGSDPDHPLQEGSDILLRLLAAAKDRALPDYLKPDDDELDAFATRLLTDALQGSEPASSVRTLTLLMQYPEHFLSKRCTVGIFHSIVFAFADNVRQLVRTVESNTSEPTTSTATPALKTSLNLISSILTGYPEMVASSDMKPFLPDFFIFGYLLPRTATADDLLEDLQAAAQDAEKIWESCAKMLPGNDEEAVLLTVKDLLKDLIADISSRPTPSDVVHVFLQSQLGSVDELMDLFPSESQLSDMFSSLPPLTNISLAAIDSLVPQYSEDDVDAQSEDNGAFDAHGFSEYARIVAGLVDAFTASRQVMREHTWAIQHLLTLSISAEQALQFPGVQNVLFSSAASKGALQEVVANVRLLTTLLLASPLDDNWHTLVTTAVVRGVAQANAKNLDSLGTFLVSLLSDAPRDESTLLSLVVREILRHLLGSATKADADSWFQVVRRLEKEAPQISLAILAAVVDSSLEPPKLERYRNELAANALGIPADKANATGLLLLRGLALSAPNPESDVVFLPQPRAVNFLKACQQWITSDEDIDEAVENEMLCVFDHLAPILQNVPGSHWDLMFDVLENSLENSSLSDETTLVALTRSLKLLATMLDLVTSNKALRAVWQEKENTYFRLVRNLLMETNDNVSNILPVKRCKEQALLILQDTPASLTDHTTFPKLCHLLLFDTASAQKMGYNILHQVSEKWTEHLVIEAGLEEEDGVKYELPRELLDLLQATFDGGFDSDAPENMRAYLFGWMVVFDLFANASLRVKIGYAEQLTNLNIVGASLLPTLFRLMDGGNNRAWLDVWTVNEYHVSLYDEDTHLSNQLLAAHLYYRALSNVPSLVSTWWSAIRDRQSSLTIGNLTSRTFSPLLVSEELAHIRDPAAAAELKDENWTIKVSPAINEVSAIFAIDDQQMEIAIKLPPDYPLHGIQVRDVKRIAVDERQWRGWLLAVQQIISSRNGRILDGLTIFKKNLAHHFEDLTECAICYSIISTTDLTLPKKRCKTCKNKFHASCLFKWFDTNHSSSCPLCRSDFI